MPSELIIMYFLNGALMWKSQIAISCYLMSADYLASIDYKYILNSDETSDYISLPIILLENAMNIDIIRPFSKGRITIFPIDRRLTCFSPFIQMKLILLNWYLEKYNCLFPYLILQAICQKSIFFFHFGHDISIYECMLRLANSFTVLRR